MPPQQNIGLMDNDNVMNNIWKEWRDGVRSDIHEMKQDISEIKLGMTDKVEIDSLRSRIRKLEDFKLILVTGAVLVNFAFAVMMRFLIK